MPLSVATRPRGGDTTTQVPLLEGDVPRVRTGILTLEVPEGATSRVACWNSPDEWLRMLAVDLDSPTGRTVRVRHKPARATVLAVAADDAAHADHRTGRNVATSHERTADRLGCTRDTVRLARRVLRDLGWSVELVRGRHLTILERMKSSLAGRHQWQAASVRALTIPARCRHLIGTAASSPEDTAGPGLENAFHPHPEGVASQKQLSTSSLNTARKRTAGTPTSHPKKNTRARPAWKCGPRGARVPVAMQRLTASLVAHVPWLDDGEHLHELARGLMRTGITPEWTAHELLSAVDERNRDRGLLSLPAASQVNPRGLLLHQLREAITGRTAPAAARAKARETAAAETAETRARLDRAEAIQAENAARRTADPRPFRQRWANTIAAAHDHTTTAQV